MMSDGKTWCLDVSMGLKPAALVPGLIEKPSQGAAGEGVAGLFIISKI